MGAYYGETFTHLVICTVWRSGISCVYLLQVAAQACSGSVFTYLADVMWKRQNGIDV